MPFHLHLVGNIPGILAHIRQRFGSEPVFRQYNRDLLVFLADPQSGPLLTQAALLERGLDFEATYTPALEETRMLLQSGNISIAGDGLLGRVECDGFWSSHMVLLNWFWNDNPLLPAKGELVIGLPTRDDLLFADTAQLPLVAMLLQEVGRRYEEGPHRISNRLFVRRNGVFERYTFGHEPGSKKWWKFWKK